MKKLSALLLVIFFFLLVPSDAQGQKIEGAWRMQENGIEHTLVLVDNYLSLSIFDLANKKFINTWGGPYTFDTNQLQVNVEFNATKKADVQKQHRFQVQLKETLSTDISGSNHRWTRVDDNQAPLAGVWRITGRQVDGQINEMPLRDRRTLKILSGTRFQWIAINIKTGEFSGTGGGTYTFVNHQYTENIEFFSRDNERVGDSLSFEGKLENGQWHHSGLSSKGDPIYEIWSKLN